ncbi:hypothetical protein PAPYR_10456 [Paratrimastix pyriformis]|uniref:Uncharacterized protein n=1 Tax=Paratrimastix pyriformis TaxID=342808 RepID=A0ABQ8U5Y8_9EUKA|nr:hypothetical protein PAPYR_10456 [Paratrimastix pyriformis]
MQTTEKQDESPRSYQHRNIELESEDPMERRREYKKKYMESVKEDQQQTRHRNKRRNIVLTETDPVKRAAEYRRKYKELRKLESQTSPSVEYSSQEALASALKEAAAAIDTLPSDFNETADLLASTLFALSLNRGHLPRNVATFPVTSGPPLSPTSGHGGSLGKLNVATIARPPSGDPSAFLASPDPP